jgi:uncharacterized protein
MTFLNRRGMFAGLMAAASAPLAAKAADDSQAQRVVYHLSDLDKVSFVLGNMENHLKGAGGPAKVGLAVVVNGPALAAFKKEGENVAVSNPMAVLLKSGVGFNACGNTLKGMKLKVGDLLDGFEEAPEGGVVRLANLQAQGWIYLRP